MELIEKQAAMDCCFKPQVRPNAEIFNALKMAIRSEISALPSIDAVPLDKLCEWLANSFSDPPCCTLENVRCKMECRGFTQMDYSECWRNFLTKWMEGLDGSESMVQKT